VPETQKGRLRFVTTRELGALVAALVRDRRRFTLEDAARPGDGAWVAYLYDAGPGRAYRVADYPAFRAYQDRDDALPEEWAVPLSRPARNGDRDYSEEEAYITLDELGRILTLDGADHAADADTDARLRALHVRYADDGDDRYRVVAHAGVAGDIEVTTLAAYADHSCRLRRPPRATPQPVTAGPRTPGGGLESQEPPCVREREARCAAYLCRSSRTTRPRRWGSVAISPRRAKRRR